MKTLSNKTDIVKVMSFGEYDFEINLNITEEQAKKFHFDLDTIKSINDMNSLLANNELKENFSVTCKNQIINLLLFMNKTNNKKIFMEYLTLNTLYFADEFYYLKDKIISDFDDYYLQIKETNFLPSNKYTLNVIVQNKGQKSFDFPISSENKIQPQEKDKLHQTKEENKDKTDFKKDEIKIVEIKKEEPMKVNSKKEESKNDPTKNEESKKNEIKIDESKKEEPKKEIPKEVEPIKDDHKKEEIKLQEPKKDEDTKSENKPKQGNEEKVFKFELPNLERPFDIKIAKLKQGFPEGKDEDFEKGIIDFNQIDIHKQSPIILSKKANLDNSSSSKKSNFNYQNKSSEEISHLKYDFDGCDYIILDLNMFSENKKMSLNVIYDYLYQNITQNYLNTSIILIFPSGEKVSAQNYAILVDLISISDIVFYDRRDAVKLCNLMGYKVEEKNFEVRFMFLKEMKRSKYKPHKTAMFLDDFNKFTIIVQETDSNLIVFHEEYNFNVGFKMEYLNTVTTNFDMLKSAFLGAVLSRVVHNDEYEYAFYCGSQTFKKLLDALHVKVDINNDPGYFVIFNNYNKNKIKQISTRKDRSIKGNNQKNFLIDSINVKNSKLKPYDPLKDRNLDSFFMNKNVKKTLRSQNIRLDSQEKESQIKSNPIEYIKQEQNKFLILLEQNQKLRKKLMNYFSSPNKNQETGNSCETQNSNMLKSKSKENTISNSRKLPVLNHADYNPFQKIANAPDYLQATEKKKINLQPIAKNSKDKPQITSENSNKTLLNPQNQPNNSSFGENSPKDKMAQTMFNNPELFQQFMATIGNNGFNTLAMKPVKPHKVKTTYNSKRSNINNNNYPKRSNSKDLYGSLDNQLADQQLNLNSSMENKSRSPSYEKKNKENKEEIKIFEPKGQYFDVDNTKTIEQIQYEEEYKLKIIERKRKEEEMKLKLDQEKIKKEEEDMKKKKNEDSEEKKQEKK